ncbi:cytochrome P450 [Stereum hirsutum FP-91666 SS1]|uniref:cytochrome P450 n=1 Tax=Stereum hirsutum (strain FP-91666) TaxID=721885 RepID=UPI0004409F19|nr:cytochrome P450 [Stereum hirsutum FP-91666 SS1]EIM88819.1 cytochrome P450 [Stereum hirsutum FP-91666 SS1]
MAFLDMSSPTVLGSTVLLAVLLRYYVLRRKTDLDVLPCPPSDEATLFYGHEKKVFDNESNEMYMKWMSALGSFYKIKAALFHEDVIVAGDNAAVAHIFQYCDNYVKSPIFRPPIANLLGRGLVWAEGDDHKLQRRILAPAFSQENVKGMADDIFESAERLETRLTNQVLANNGGATVNIVEQTSSCTLDIIGRVAFGHDFGSGESAEAKEIASAWHNHVNMGLTYSGFIAPLLVRTFPWIVKLPIPALQAQGTTKMIVDRLTKRIIEKGVVNEKGRDILSLLMMANRDAKEGNKLTDEQLVANVNTFIMVGHETTAGSVALTTYALARNPEMQQKLRDELISAGDITYESIQKLEYLDAIVKEGLRVYPASPHTERINLEDDVIPLSKPITTTDGRKITSYHAKAGTIFHIPFTAMNVNPEVWGEDAHIFKPERWIIPGGVPQPSELPHGWSGLVTFCDGPRNCIGWRLAVLEFKVLIATLFRSLEFQATTADVKQMISPTLQAVVDDKGGFLPLHITLAQH